MPRKPQCAVCRAPLLDNGECRYRCPPEAAGRHLRAIDKAARARQRQADRGDTLLSPEESSAGVKRALTERAAIVSRPAWETKERALKKFRTDRKHSTRAK